MSKQFRILGVHAIGRDCSCPSCESAGPVAARRDTAPVPPSSLLDAALRRDRGTPEPIVLPNYDPTRTTLSLDVIFKKEKK
jgi:hypothetical protein